MFPTNCECLIGISDAFFLPFVYGYPSSCPRAHCTPYKSVPTLRYTLSLLSCCLTSTEARWPIRDGDRVGRGRESEGSTAETVQKRPERLWTAARTMEVLRRCPLAIAQFNCRAGHSHKDIVRCTAVAEHHLTYKGEHSALDDQINKNSK